MEAATVDFLIAKGSNGTILNLIPGESKVDTELMKRCKQVYVESGNMPRQDYCRTDN